MIEAVAHPIKIIKIPNHANDTANEWPLVINNLIDITECKTATINSNATNTIR